MRPGDNGRVRGGPPGLMSPDALLVLVNHGGNGERILRGPLPGVLGCHPGGTTVSQDLQCCGRRDYL